MSRDQSSFEEIFQRMAERAHAKKHSLSIPKPKACYVPRQVTKPPLKTHCSNGHELTEESIYQPEHSPWQCRKMSCRMVPEAEDNHCKVAHPV